MGDALKHCAELKALFRRQTGGWMDPERLSRVTSSARARCIGR
jgi:hypothetical protein